jgi:hypothetical protein
VLIFFLEQPGFKRNGDISRVRAEFQALFKSIDATSDEPLIDMQNENHQKSNRCEGAIEDKLLNDQPSDRGLGIVDRVRY